MPMWGADHSNVHPLSVQDGGNVDSLRATGFAAAPLVWQGAVPPLEI